MFRRDPTACSKYDHHSRFNSEHKLGVPMRLINELGYHHVDNEEHIHVLLVGKNERLKLVSS